MIINTVYNSTPLLFLQMFHGFAGYSSESPYCVLYKKNMKLYAGKSFKYHGASDDVFQWFSPNQNYVDLINQINDLNVVGFEWLSNYQTVFNKIVSDYQLVYSNDNELYEQIAKINPFVVFDIEGHRVPHTLSVNVDGFLMMLHIPPTIEGYYDFKTVPHFNIYRYDHSQNYPKTEDSYYDSTQYPNFIYPVIKNYNYDDVNVDSGIFIPLITRNRVLNDNFFQSDYVNRISFNRDYTCEWALSHYGVFGDQRHKQYLENNKEKIREVFY